MGRKKTRRLSKGSTNTIRFPGGDDGRDRPDAEHGATREFMISS